MNSFLPMCRGGNPAPLCAGRLGLRQPGRVSPPGGRRRRRRGCPRGATLRLVVAWIREVLRDAQRERRTWRRRRPRGLDQAAMGLSFPSGSSICHVPLGVPTKPAAARPAGRVCCCRSTADLGLPARNWWARGPGRGSRTVGAWDANTGWPPAPTVTGRGLASLRCRHGAWLSRKS